MSTTYQDYQFETSEFGAEQDRPEVQAGDVIQERRQELLESLPSLLASPEVQAHLRLQAIPTPQTGEGIPEELPLEETAMSQADFITRAERLVEDAFLTQQGAKL